MVSSNSFRTTLDILHRTMDVNLLRQDVIANNIANADTPNFKRTVVNFESKLSEALANEGKAHFRAARTQPSHFDFRAPLKWREVLPRRILDSQSSAKNNGNNVDIEVETSELLNNRLLYTLMSSSVDMMFDRLRVVLV